MIDNQDLLEQLKNLLSWKKSKKFYAQKLNITEQEVEDLLNELKNKEVNFGKEIYKDSEIKFQEDFVNNTASIDYKGPVEIKTKEQLFKECNVDEEKWNVDKMVVNAWGKEGNQAWQVKAYLSIKKGAGLFQEKFIDFLSTYEPKTEYDNEFTLGDNDNLPYGCLIINKQDEHLNKYDIHGDNNILDRFTNVYKKVNIILQKAALSTYLEKIIYVIGSDEFNSEWSSATTKGTPQKNIHTYEDSFQMICDYEIAMINNLKSKCYNLDVIYIQGNHDEFVGWHLAQFLKSYFRGADDVIIDVDNVPTKYRRYSNTAMMFNHGDAIKPAKLANIFPVQFRKEWSLCDNFYIFTGDKHFEKSEDFHGIMFYQLPALSKSTGRWENKEGHLESKCELTAFVIEENIGRTDILKQPL